MKVLIFQHIKGEHPAAFAQLMDAYGDAYDVVHLFNDDPIPDTSPYDMLLVMGGPMDVWEEADNPWLVREKQAIRHWVKELKRPYLGICLGHQLLADALGGTCGFMDQPEAGLLPVTITAAGKVDPIFQQFEATLTCMQWHGVHVNVLPENTVCLAENDACATQAIRYGAHAYGVQFHPELISGLLEDWLSDAPNRDWLENFLGKDGAQQMVADVNAQISTVLETSQKWLFSALLSRKRCRPPSNLLICMVSDNFT